MIRVVIFDIDGVLTDGTILINNIGEEQKRINLKDIDAVFELQRKGYKIGAITGEKTAIVEYFRNRFKWDYFFCGIKKKIEPIKQIEALEEISCEQICYIGDGKYDVDALGYVGFGVCPSDAIIDAKRQAKIVLKTPAGHGCVWELIGELEVYNAQVKPKSFNEHRTIGILGASGHVAQAVLHVLQKSQNNAFYLFSRDIHSYKPSLLSDISPERACICDYSMLAYKHMDVIINCIGYHKDTLASHSGSLFDMTEKYNNIVLEYLNKHPDTLYINISSGIVYGQNYTIPADKNTPAQININKLSSGEMQSVIKLYTEAKHRAHIDNNIVDLRIYGFFSRFINVNYSFLLAEIVRCIKNKTAFITNSTDIIRDYIHLDDLRNLLECIITQHKLNTSFDVCSTHPVSKFELLNFFSNHYGLEVQMTSSTFESATGIKPQYYSKNKPTLLGYRAKFSAMDCVQTEVQYLLNHYIKTN